jgi:hypothetical protein
VTRLVLDAGALLAWDRRDRAVAARLEAARRRGLDLRTTAIVLAQVWRDGARQANLARLLKGTEVVAVDERLGREAGALLARSGTDDPIDATVVIVAAPGDRVLTSDPGDIRLLADAGNRTLMVIAC